MPPNSQIPPPVFPPSDKPGFPPHGVPQPYHPPQPTPATDKTDALGIFSIVLAFTGLAFFGFFVGLIGDRTAKKEGRSPALSRIGWISSLVFMLITLAAFIIILAAIPSNVRNARDTNTQNDINYLGSQLESFRIKNGYYPATLSELGPNLRITDSLGRPYTYAPGPTGCQRCETYLLEATLEDGTKFQYGQLQTGPKLQEL